MVGRYSTRTHALGDLLRARLAGARAYDRVAGYFSSGILEIAGEELEAMDGPVRVVCNSDLDPRDVAAGRAAQLAMRREWTASEPEALAAEHPSRFARLHRLFAAGRLHVRVLPNATFGLMHGKAGVVTLADGRRTGFLGSVNETRRAWLRNYEMLWEDDAPEAVAWVQGEFDALWNHPCAVPLAEFVVEDVGRLAARTVVPSVAQWRELAAADPDVVAPAAAIETPVYRAEFGLWEHQKAFVKRAFDEHRTAAGARLVLADQVGLGKTVQLGLAAMLMALHGERPVLVLAPKALLWQWQGELRDLLALPSAVWDGRRWTDEVGVEHAAVGPEGIRRCPRRVGIVSQGLVTSGSEAAAHLLTERYECVVVDEAHRARRRNLGEDREDETPDANHLLAFLRKLAHRTHSLLLATATPVQLYPVEAWDLLSVLAEGHEHVLGSVWSRWRLDVRGGLAVTVGRAELPADPYDAWTWMRDPLPPRSEGTAFDIVRRALVLGDDQAVAPAEGWDRLRPADQSRLRGERRTFGREHNPFIRAIVRRTRQQLETEVDPATGEPYLKPVRVVLHGEGEAGAIGLPPYLHDAYQHAETFCRSLAARAQGAGFLKTLLLRRVGSTIHAGRLTAEGMLGDWAAVEQQADEDEVPAAERQPLRTLMPSERETLQRFVDALEANQARDPKYACVVDYLLGRGWLEEGCIVFSQYYDSARWLAEELSRLELPEEPIGLYAGSGRSGLVIGGEFRPADREELKRRVQGGSLRLLLGTDAASEGLNLQRLGRLINLDLPWNPTRLEQRKGRIQRIGQVRDEVHVYNMRYRDSVEDRVHELLSERLQHVYDLFGQIPDVLEDAWVSVALGDVEQARRTIGGVPNAHPFSLRNQRVRPVDWESCATVLDAGARRAHLVRGW